MPPFTSILEKLSEKGHEHCSDHGFGRYTEPKWSEKPLLGGPQGYAVDAPGAFRTVSNRRSRKPREPEGKRKPPACLPRASKRIRLFLPHPTFLTTTRTSSLSGTSFALEIASSLSRARRIGVALSPKGRFR
jgi:hypothetical protein